MKGEVVSCETISQDSTFTGGVQMDCLDRSEGAQLGALRGPMVVNVWGSWCGPCKKEMPVLRAFHDKAQGKVQLIGVDVEEANFDDGRTFVERNGITWPNLYDPDGRSREYFGLGVPVTWFIAADGAVSLVQPKRRDNRPKCVSTVIPGVSKAWPKTTFAVLRPTPGKVINSSRVRGSSPPKSSSNFMFNAFIFRAFAR